MVELRSLVFYSTEERERWRQGRRCLIWSKLRRIGGLGGLMMAPRRSSGCGACIPELTKRRHLERLLCLGSRAKASTLRGRHARFHGSSVFHTWYAFSWAPLLLGNTAQQKWYHHLQQQLEQSLIPHNNYYIYQVQHIYYAGVPSNLYVAHTHTGAQGTLSLSKNCTSRESVSPLSRLIRGFRNKYH